MFTEFLRRYNEEGSFVFIYGSELLPHDGLRGAENVGGGDSEEK